MLIVDDPFEGRRSIGKSSFSVRWYLRYKLTPRPAFGWRGSIEALRPEDGGDFRTDPVQFGQRRRWRAQRVGVHPSSSSLRSERLARSQPPWSLERELKSIKLAADLSFEMRRQGTCIARLQLVEPFAWFRRSGWSSDIPSENSNPWIRLTCCHPLVGQRLALTAKSAAVFLLWCRRPDRGAGQRFAALLRQQRAHQGFAVDLVGLNPPPAPRCGRSRASSTTWLSTPSFCQHAINPKAVQPCLLDGDDIERICRSARDLLLELR